MKRMISNSLLWVAVLALFLTGCAGGKETPAADPAQSIHAVIDMQPSQPVANQDTQFRVTISEPDRDVKVEKAQVTMFLEMKEMDHGEHRIPLTESEPGVYQGKGAFPMTGVWVAHIRAEKNGTTRTANVDLKVQ